MFEAVFLYNEMFDVYAVFSIFFFFEWIMAGASSTHSAGEMTELCLKYYGREKNNNIDIGSDSDVGLTSAVDRFADEENKSDFESETANDISRRHTNRCYFTHVVDWNKKNKA